jgi:hypothetical protein
MRRSTLKTVMDTFIGSPQLGFALFFVAVWLAVSFLLSYISGWAFVAEHYRSKRPFAGRYERIPSSQMGPLGPFGGARNALYVGVDSEALHLRMFFLFRVNCRDLSIPWRDITVTRGKSFFMNYMEFHFRQAPKIAVRIYGKAGEVIRTLAGSAWPSEMAPDPVRA